MAQKVVSWSWYPDPIQPQADGLIGRTRNWGDVTPQVKDQIINMTIASSQQAGLSNHETALFLSLMYTESGFNPSAAAKTTSAQGLGQMVDATGTAYGLTEANQWSAQSQIDAALGYFKYCEKLVAQRGQDASYVYKYWHDGPTGDYGGLKISSSKVMPAIPAWERLVNGWSQGGNNASSESPAITDSAGNIIGYSVSVLDSTNSTAISTFLKADGSIASQSFYDGATVTTIQGGITTTQDVATGVTTASIEGLGSSFVVGSDGTVVAGGYLITLPSDPLGNINVQTAGGTSFTLPAGANITSNGENLIVQNDGVNGNPSQMIQRDGSGVQCNYDSNTGAFTGTTAIGANSTLSDTIGSFFKQVGQAVLDFLIPSAYGADTFTDPATNATTSSWATASGGQASISYDSNGGISGMSVQTSDVGGVKTTISTDAASGLTTTTNVDSATGQLLSSSSVDIAANTGTTQAYTNGVLTSKTDFGPTGSTVTSYSGGLVSGVDSVYSDNSRCSIQYDAYGNTVSSSITDANGAITSATTMADGSIFTRYPDGAVSSTTLNDAGLPTVVTQYANGSSSVISYTGAGTSVTLPNGMLSNIVDQNAGVSFAAFTNPDGSGSSASYLVDGTLASESYSYAVLFGRKMRCEAAANDAAFGMRMIA